MHTFDDIDCGEIRAPFGVFFVQRRLRAMIDAQADVGIQSGETLQTSTS
jgi:hypothetical protein